MTSTSEKDKDANIDLERLAHAKIKGPGVTLAYMSDDKTHVSYSLCLLSLKISLGCTRKNQSKLSCGLYC